MKKLILLFGLAIATSAYAVPTDLIIDFDKPIVREDGDPLLDEDIAEYVFYDSCVAAPTEILRLSNSGNVSSAATTVDWTDNSSHSICFSAVDTDNVEGALSDSYNFTFDLIGRPGKGSIRSITVTCTAQRCRVVIN